MSDCYEKPYVHKLGNLDKMDQFLQRNNLLKHTQEEIDNLNRPISV